MRARERGKVAAFVAAFALLCLSVAPYARAQTGGRAANMRPRGEPAPVVQQAIALAAATEAPLEIFRDGFEGEADGGGPPIPVDPSACKAADGSWLPGILPTGWPAITRSWVDAFSAPICMTSPRDPRCRRAAYPTGLGVPVPIGALKQTITVIPFTATARMTVNLSWDGVQANPAIGYPKPRPADAMFIAISNCAGDVRPPNAASNVPMLQNGCRRLAGGATLTHSTMPGMSSEYVCRLTPGITYFLNVMAANPVDGLTVGEHTCSDSAVNSAFGCDVQAVHNGTPQ